MYLKFFLRGIFRYIFIEQPGNLRGEIMEYYFNLKLIIQGSKNSSGATEKYLFVTFYLAQYFQVLDLGELCFSVKQTNYI